MTWTRSEGREDEDKCAYLKSVLLVMLTQWGKKAKYRGVNRARALWHEHIKERKCHFLE